MNLYPFKINPNQLKPHEIQNCLDESQKPSVTGHEAVLSIKILELLQHIAWQDEQLKTHSKDTERLNFLDSCSKRLNDEYGTIYHWKLILSSHVVRLFLPGKNPHRDGLGPVDLNDANCGKDSYDSCRKAIDKAMNR